MRPGSMHYPGSHSVAPLLPVSTRAQKGKRGRAAGVVQFIAIAALLLVAGYGLFVFSYFERSSAGRATRGLQESAGTGAAVPVADPTSADVIFHDGAREDEARRNTQGNDLHRNKGKTRAPVLDPTRSAHGGEPHGSKDPLTYAPQVKIESDSHTREEVHAPVITTQQPKQQQQQPQQQRAAHLPVENPAHTGLYSLTAIDINGNERKLSDFAGKVVLVVNVASHCGYTDQNYKGLMKTYEKYGPFGFEVLAFPSDQFGHQEPGTEAEIKEFCTSRYRVSFPMFSKVEVNGPGTHPVFQFLKKELPVSEGGGGGHDAGRDLTWNFNKFLVNKHGYPEKYFNQEYDIAAVEHEVYRMMSTPY